MYQASTHTQWTPNWCAHMHWVNIHSLKFTQISQKKKKWKNPDKIKWGICEYVIVSRVRSHFGTRELRTRSDWVASQQQRALLHYGVDLGWCFFSFLFGVVGSNCAWFHRKTTILDARRREMTVTRLCLHRASSPFQQVWGPSRRPLGGTLNFILLVEYLILASKNHILGHCHRSPSPFKKNFNGYMLQKLSRRRACIVIK